MGFEAFDFLIFKPAPGMVLEFYRVNRSMVIPVSSQEPAWSFRLDFCRCGRFEGEFKRRRFDCLSEGEFALNNYSYTMLSHVFPLERYEGLSLICYEDELSPGDKAVLQDMQLDFAELNERYDTAKRWYRRRADGPILDILNALYRVLPQPDDIYLRLKILELLYWLNRPEEESLGEDTYLTEDRAAQVRSFTERLLNEEGDLPDLEKELARCGIDKSSFYRRFKAVYHETPARFFRQYRLNKAAVRLRISADPIAEIAEAAGYKNPAKFAAAFAREYGLTPLKYRQSAADTDLQV